MHPRLVGSFFLLALLARPAAAQQPVVTTREDAQGVSLTVYNGNYAVVRERRDLALPPGRSLVRWEGVAQQIEAPTVSFKSLTAPGAVVVREQNYQYDLVSANAVLEKSVGRTVRIRRNGEVAVEGTLLSAPGSGGGMVIRTTDGRLLLNPYGEVEVAEMPAGLISRPSLLWVLDADRAGRHTAEVSYMTGGVNWSADYVAVVDSAESRVDLTGWVTLVNKSGAAYPEAQLQLMAGDVRRLRRGIDPNQPLQLEAIVVTGMAAKEPQFAEEAFFEYHLYTLDGRTTLAENETKQMTLLSAQGVGVSRRLVFDSRRGWGWWWGWQAG